jgi:hypothetical protein
MLLLRHRTNDTRIPLYFWAASIYDCKLPCRIMVHTFQARLMLMCWHMPCAQGCDTTM